jgi:hypothetical protein
MTSFPAVGSSAACRGSISQPPEAPNSLVAGKNAGNFAESAFFCENSSRKPLRIQRFATSIPYAAEQGIISRKQGIDSAFSTRAGNLARSRPLRASTVQVPQRPFGHG